MPQECQYLTDQSKDDVLQQTKCNEQGSKVDHFFTQIEDLHNEMMCQQALERKAIFISHTALRINTQRWISVCPREDDDVDS